jgi:hypothetical protein
METIEVAGSSVYPPDYRRRLMRVLLERVLDAIGK